ncbi:Alpha/Beta hydrolase protein [Aspergillus californicus]
MSNDLENDGLNPNPPLRLSAWDICSTLITLMLYAPLSVLASLYQGKWNSMGEQISHDLLLCFGHRLPVSVIQRASEKNGSTLRQSIRYTNAPFQIAERVRKPDFAGYWVYRDTSIESHPEDADVVLFHLHGGGYVMGHPLDNAPEMLLIAEALTGRNYTVAVFSLEYTLVPSAPLPTQLDQTTAAYTWLINEINVSPSRLYLIGESAGGHLILSLLTSLHRRLLEQSSFLPKPGAAFLISPWMNLDPCGPNSTVPLDSLDPRSVSFKQVLQRFSALVLHDVPRKYINIYGNFAHPIPEQKRGSWKDILPAKTWVSAGTAEPLFRFDIEVFVDAARRDGAQVRLELGEGKVHVWQSVEAREQEGRFLAMAPGEDDKEVMGGYRAVAEALGDCLEGDILRSTS